jgi:hypothetical protein
VSLCCSGRSGVVYLRSQCPIPHSGRSSAFPVLVKEKKGRNGFCVDAHVAMIDSSSRTKKDCYMYLRYPVQDPSAEIVMPWYKLPSTRPIAL